MSSYLVRTAYINGLFTLRDTHTGRHTGVCACVYVRRLNENAVFLPLARVSPHFRSYLSTSGPCLSTLCRRNMERHRTSATNQSAPVFVRRQRTDASVRAAPSAGGGGGGAGGGEGGGGKEGRPRERWLEKNRVTEISRIFTGETRPVPSAAGVVYRLN